MKTSAEDPYHAGSRHWQDRFDSRRLADRLAEKLSRSELTADDCAFIARQPLFFPASTDAAGQQQAVLDQAGGPAALCGHHRHRPARSED